MLKDSTFIIPIRIESEDRMRNIITVLVFLLENFDAKIILKEVDTESVFGKEVFPQLQEHFDNLDRLTHIFQKSYDSVFYRMHILNDMLSICDTKVVINCDCDIILPIQSYVDSYNMIINDNADVVYPYGNGNYQKQVFVDDETVSNFLSNEFDFSILDKKSKVWTSDFGWIQFFDRNVYLNGGMENENFRGSSPEDKERYFRFTKMGYRVERIDNFIYHFEHSRGANSWPTSIRGNPYMESNIQEWEKIQKMNKNEIVNYYSTQKYLERHKHE